ncbi:hypothetical protein DUNSADRAFT_236 [Dunaliella salina]|uniref:Calponin-homology (CH) domain-containing protein n=1 Tax=Dunaliella salina TaxID=3046 RepID=A0ABQ7GYK0_DUNSA|nr:hypothetical protein DUNSADRAFT_236 [Dunaliella salina]|eukprot:KAF5839685.1 hypothetical protein DUNSADRAFT_236 [Dunaliella salina]
MYKIQFGCSARLTACCHTTLTKTFCFLRRRDNKQAANLFFILSASSESARASSPKRSVLILLTPLRMMMEVSEAELQGLYTWVDEIPLSRPKRNIARDFSDGVLFAEVVAYYFPKLVDLHNYSAANNTTQKMYNWNTMNQKVFKRLGFSVAKQDFEAIANCQPGAIERLLKLAKIKIAKFQEEGGARWVLQVQ